MTELTVEQSKLRIFALADTVFGNRVKAESWLTQPKKRFQGATPAVMLTRPEGAALVEELLHQIDEGMMA